MTTRPRLRTLPPLAVLAALALAGPACHAPAGSLRFESYKDPFFPERYGLDIETCAYRTSASGDLHVACRTDSPAGNPTGQPLAQYLHVNIYWRPRPGWTYADPSTSDALVRYVVASARGALVYSGTGFAMTCERDDGGLELTLESARLRLESRRGELPDFLGHARVGGRLLARPDPGTTARIVREMELVGGR